MVKGALQRFLTIIAAVQCFIVAVLFESLVLPDGHATSLRGDVKHVSGDCRGQQRKVAICQ